MSVRHLIAACALLTLALPHAAHAQDGRFIRVEGVGVVQAVPDMAIIRLGVEATAETAADAAAEMSAAAARLIAVLDAAGIAERDRQTAGLGLAPRYRAGRGQADIPEIIGYVASTTLTVTVRDLAAVGGVLDALTEAGANRIDGIAFEIARPEQLTDAARRAAMADAARRARLYAEEAGETLGRVLRIEEATSGLPRPQMMARADMMMDAAIAPGELELEARVQVVYRLRPEGADAD